MSRSPKEVRQIFYGNSTLAACLVLFEPNLQAGFSIEGQRFLCCDEKCHILTWQVILLDEIEGQMLTGALNYLQNLAVLSLAHELLPSQLCYINHP